MLGHLILPGKVETLINAAVRNARLSGLNSEKRAEVVPD